MKRDVFAVAACRAARQLSPRMGVPQDRARRRRRPAYPIAAAGASGGSPTGSVQYDEMKATSRLTQPRRWSMYLSALPRRGALDTARSGVRRRAGGRPGRARCRDRKAAISFASRGCEVHRRTRRPGRASAFEKQLSAESADDAGAFGWPACWDTRRPRRGLSAVSLVVASAHRESKITSAIDDLRPHLRMTVPGDLRANGSPLKALQE